MASSVLAAPAQDSAAALRKFWSAKDPSAAARAADDVIRSGASFDDLFAALKRGRAYAADVPKGSVRGARRGLAGQFDYVLDVPKTYDPAHAYQVRFQLHGGVMRDAPSIERLQSSLERIAGAEQIYVVPAGWNEAPWWSLQQIQNLRLILDSIKRTYNVDENRVAVTGISDGGTGAFYVALRDQTPYSSFLPLNGSIAVLSNSSLGVEGDLFTNNLLNRPFFIVNGGRDHLYPTAYVEPYLKRLFEGGVQIDYHPQPNAGHDTSWWPAAKETFERFVREHPRNPYPDRLTWQAAETRETNRFHWLVIDKLGTRPSDAPAMKDLNDDVPDMSKGGRPSKLFAVGKRAGRVDLVRKGNAVDATTRGVAEFTLLLSPDQFDFTQPVVVTVNGRAAFAGKVEKSLEALMKWAARDNDRTMLFGAEVHIKVP